MDFPPSLKRFGKPKHSPFKSGPGRLGRARAALASAGTGLRAKASARHAPGKAAFEPELPGRDLAPGPRTAPGSCASGSSGASPIASPGLGTRGRIATFGGAALAAGVVVAALALAVSSGSRSPGPRDAPSPSPPHPPAAAPATKVVAPPVTNESAAGAHPARRRPRLCLSQGPRQGAQSQAPGAPTPTRPPPNRAASPPRPKRRKRPRRRPSERSSRPMHPPRPPRSAPRRPLARPLQRRRSRPGTRHRRCRQQLERRRRHASRRPPGRSQGDQGRPQLRRRLRRL